MSDQSVKAQVIALAQEDPFLTVEALAQKVGTTTRYVRTILSEADLSLNQMRKDYARLLERRLKEQNSQEEFTVQQELKIRAISWDKLSQAPNNWSGRELFQASSLQKIGSLLSYVQLITPECLEVRTDYSSLRELLPAAILQDLEVGEQRAEIVFAPAQLEVALNLPNLSQVLKLTTMLHRAGVPLALEISWLALEGLVLKWSKEEPELKVFLTG